LPSHLDEVSDERGKLGFNGKDTIREKVMYAKKMGLGGVMIWEAGQDCRVEAVTRHGKTHMVTCPVGPASSLLVSITVAVQEPPDREKTEL
jgi:GH18 family chitinase